MNVGGSAMPGSFAVARGRFRMLAVALVLITGLAAATAWMLARADWWTTPIRQIERALDAGDLSRAGMLLTRLIRDDPRQAHARLLYARLLRLSGRPRDADVALAKAMDMGAPEASLWREYGLLLADSDFRKAERILQRALKAQSRGHRGPPGARRRPLPARPLARGGRLLLAMAAGRTRSDRSDARAAHGRWSSPVNPWRPCPNSERSSPASPTTMRRGCSWPTAS